MINFEDIDYKRLDEETEDDYTLRICALKEIKPVVNPTPLAITFWETSDFEPVIGIVNLSQTMPTAFIPTFNGDFAKYNGLLRLSPGQLVVFTKNKVCPEQ